MTRQELNRRYPECSEDFLKLNSSDSVPPPAKPESDSQHEPVAKEAGAGPNVGFRFVLVTSFRLRLIDADNLFAKYIVDCCVKAGLLRDDSPHWCKVQVGQIKVDNPAEERTVIEIFEDEKARRDAELTMKEWVTKEAERLGLTPSGVRERYYKGQYPGLRLRRINKRVVMVTDPQEAFRG